MDFTLHICPACGSVEIGAPITLCREKRHHSEGHGSVEMKRIILKGDDLPMDTVFALRKAVSR